MFCLAKGFAVYTYLNIGIVHFWLQDSFLADDFKSQADGMLSQDSTYQGDRMFYASQLSQGPFN